MYITKQQLPHSYFARACLHMTTPTCVGRTSIFCSQVTRKLVGRRQPSKPEVVDRMRPLVELSQLSIVCKVVSGKGPWAFWAMVFCCTPTQAAPSIQTFDQARSTRLATPRSQPCHFGKSLRSKDGHNRPSQKPNAARDLSCLV